EISVPRLIVCNLDVEKGAIHGPCKRQNRYGIEKPLKKTEIGRVMDFSPLRRFQCSVLFENLVEQYSVHLIIGHAVRSPFIISSTDLHAAWQLAQQVNKSTVVEVRLVKPSLIFI